LFLAISFALLLCCGGLRLLNRVLFILLSGGRGAFIEFSISIPLRICSGLLATRLLSTGGPEQLKVLVASKLVTGREEF